MSGMGIGIGIGLGGAGGSVAARSATVSASATGALYSLTRLLGGSSGLALISGTNGNLTLSGATVNATAALGVGNSQVAMVRETNGVLAVEYPLTLTGQPAAPAAPTIGGVTAANGQLSIAFNDGATGGSPITGHKVYRGTTSGSETLLGTLSGASPFVDTGLTNGTAYYYRLSAVDAIGESPLSNEVSGTPVAATQLPKASSIFDRMSADTLTGLSNGAGVASWPGVNGAMTAAQATSANRPTYVASSLGGKPAVRGATTSQAASQFMQFGSNAALNTALTANQVAMLIVFHAAGSGLNGLGPVFSSSLADGTASWVLDDGSRVGSYNDDTPSGLTGFHTLMVIRDNAPGQTPRLRYVLNGMAVSISNTAKFTASTAGYELFRGFNNGSADFFANATISDIVIWSGARLTQADTIQAHKWACDKYGQAYPWSGLSSIKVIAGDSIPSASGQAHDNNVYNLLKADLGFSHGQACTIATPSIGLTEMRTQLQDDLDGITAQTGLPYRVVFGEWANSAGPTPADSQVAAMTALLNDRQSARGAGSKVGIWDSTAYGGNTSEGDQISLGGPKSADGNGRLNYGTRIAALTSMFDNFQQVSADANIGVIGANPYAGTWPTTHFQDEKHLVAAGLTILANYYKAAFAAMG